MLVVDAVEHAAGSTTVTVQAPDRIYRMEVDDADEAATIARRLRDLTGAGHPFWAILRDAAPGSGWHALASFLDRHSLIGEPQGNASILLAESRQRLLARIDATRIAALAGLAAEAAATVVGHASIALRKFEVLRGPGSPAMADALLDASAEPNFFLALLQLELCYLRKFFPLAFDAAGVLLRSLAEGESATAGTAPAIDAVGIYDERELDMYLWLVSRVLVLSSGAQAMRLPTPEIPIRAPVSGLEFIRQLEIMIGNTSNRWGASSYQSAIADPPAGYSPVVAGTFVEQYHVTRRFVEIVTPLLGMRLAPPLRAQVFRYFNEEYGHEALEANTCKALGIDESELKRSVPLPLHTAFVDLLTLVATHDPIAAFGAVIFMEGMFGSPPGTSTRLCDRLGIDADLRAAICKHDELNLMLHHNSLSRTLFEPIGAIGSAEQSAVSRQMLFLLELNRRAWDEVATFYGPQDRLSLHGPLGQSLGANHAP